MPSKYQLTVGYNFPFTDITVIYHITVILLDREL